MPLERASSFVSLSFSLLSLSFSFSKSTRSSSGRYATASGITTDTASSPIPALPCCTVISLVNARFTYTSLLSSNIFLTDSSSLVMKSFAFLEGGTSIWVRTFLIPFTRSLQCSIAASSVWKFHSFLYSGHLESMIVSSSDWSVQKISSVINGIYG